MSLGDLIERLESIRDNTDDGESLPVRIAFQRSWPLAACVDNVSLIVADEEPGIPSPTAVWIAASDSVSCKEYPYAPREAWRS